jgi:hypothetical protein
MRVLTILLLMTFQTGLLFAASSATDNTQTQNMTVTATAGIDAPSCTCDDPPSATHCSVTCNEGDNAVCGLDPVLEECRCKCQ